MCRQVGPWQLARVGSPPVVGVGIEHAEGVWARYIASSPEGLQPPRVVARATASHAGGSGAAVTTTLHGRGGGGAAAIALAVSHGFALRQPARPRERGVKGEMGRGPADQREASFSEGARFWGTPRRKRDSGKLLRGKGRPVDRRGGCGWRCSPL
jgi:hypothetical protein